MMAGNPNWWSMNNSMHPQPFQHQLSINPQQYHQFVYGSSNIVTSSADSAAADDHNPCQDYPVRSLSQLLLGSFGSEEDRYGGAGPFQPLKKLENWEDQVLNDVNPYDNSLTRSVIDDDVKQEHQLIPQSSMCQQLNDHSNHDAQQYSCSSTVRSCNNNTSSTWRAHLQQQLMPVVSSPTSCVTTLNTGFLDLSAGGKKVTNKGQHQHNQDHSSECNSTSTGGVAKKVKVQQSSAQPAMKVRKEKLGDRITVLHQIVSPFGKTDTASVLSEAIGYIRFLHGQIEALSAPYIRNASAASSTSHHLHSHELGDELVLKDLRSRGLCLVPVSCTQNVCNNNDSGADYWAPAAFGGGGF